MQWQKSSFPSTSYLIGLVSTALKFVWTGQCESDTSYVTTISKPWPSQTIQPSISADFKMLQYNVKTTNAIPSPPKKKKPLVSSSNINPRLVTASIVTVAATRRLTIGDKHLPIERGRDWISKPALQLALIPNYQTFLILPVISKGEGSWEKEHKQPLALHSWSRSPFFLYSRSNSSSSRLRVRLLQ